MSDTRRERKPRQVRGTITGGLADCEDFLSAIEDHAQEQGFEVTFVDGPKRFGDVGPLHKVSWGVTEKL